MKPQDKFFLVGLIVLSVLTSFMFINYGVGVISGGEAPRWVYNFAVVTAGYGLGNIAILSLAWNTREPWAIAVSKLISLCYLGAFTIDAINAGFSSGVEVVGILLLSLVLWLNWFTIKKVVGR